MVVPALHHLMYLSGIHVRGCPLEITSAGGFAVSDREPLSEARRSLSEAFGDYVRVRLSKTVQKQTRAILGHGEWLGSLELQIQDPRGCNLFILEKTYAFIILYYH